MSYTQLNKKIPPPADLASQVVRTMSQAAFSSLSSPAAERGAALVRRVGRDLPRILDSGKELHDSN